MSTSLDFEQNHPSKPRRRWPMWIFGGLLVAGAVTWWAFQPTDYSDEFAAHEAEVAAQTDVREVMFSRGDHSLYARVFGAADSDQPPIFALHGLPDSSVIWDELGVTLAPDRQMIAFDFLGWGRSGRHGPGEVSNPASLLADLDAAVAHFAQEGRVELIAHDISALPVIDWALANPERVKRIVLLNSVYHYHEEFHPPETLLGFAQDTLWRDIQVMGAKLNHATWQSAFEAQLDKFFVRDDVRSKYVPIFSHLSLEFRPAFFQFVDTFFEEIAARSDRLDEMRAFEAPVLVLFGSEDLHLDGVIAADFASTFPNAEMRMMEGVGHYPQLSATEEVAAAILTR